MGFTELWLILTFVLISGSLGTINHPARMSYAYDIVGGDHVVSGL